VENAQPAVLEAHDTQALAEHDMSALADDT